MVHAVAAAGLELYGPAIGRPLCSADACQRDTGLQGDRNAEQQPDRIHHGLLRRRHRLCLDLAHLVDGGAGPARRLRRAARLRLPPPGGDRGVRRRDCSFRQRSSGGGHAMNVAVALSDVRRPEVAASEAGPAPKPVVVAYGFWIFLLSDIVMFATLFAGYAVLARATDGGPGGVQLFSQASVAIETVCLLASSYTCGLMSLAVKAQRRFGTYFRALVTFALGLAFLVLELREVTDMISPGAGPQRSAFLSAFFTLFGCHRLPGTARPIWLTVVMVQLALRGFHPTVQRRLACFSLFWHALDIVWVWLFTVVYLIGVRA